MNSDRVTCGASSCQQSVPAKAQSLCQVRARGSSKLETYPSGKHIEPKMQEPDAQVPLLFKKFFHGRDQCRSSEIGRQNRRRIFMLQGEGVWAAHGFCKVPSMQLQKGYFKIKMKNCFSRLLPRMLYNSHLWRGSSQLALSASPKTLGSSHPRSALPKSAAYRNSSPTCPSLRSYYTRVLQSR